MGRKTLRIAAYKDQFPLAVTVFTSSGYRYDFDKIVVVINNATGVSQNFYSAYARYNETDYPSDLKLAY
jgi:hypothetical protein